MLSSDNSNSIENIRINLYWLILLRWAAIAAQLLGILVSYLFIREDFSRWQLYFLVEIAFITNLLSTFWYRYTYSRQPIGIYASYGEILLVILMLVDIVILTGLLYLSGGPSNPFCMFYIVNISLAAAILDATWAWLLTTIAIAGYCLLFKWHVPILELGNHSDHIHASSHLDLPVDSLTDLHLKGMLVAFAGAAVFVTYFVTRVRRELQKSNLLVSHLEQRKANSDRLSSLVTLAAGAAHELSTPLATISVVANELVHQSKTMPLDSHFTKDATLILQELDRCKSIIRDMSAFAGESLGESLKMIQIQELSRMITDAIPTASVKVESRLSTALIQIPVHAFMYSIKNIYKNALEASDFNSDSIRIYIWQEHIHHNDELCISVNDNGSGIPDDIVDRVGEPFFSTKNPGQGMGLGLFVAKRMAEQIGAKLIIESNKPCGTRVKIIVKIHSYGPAMDKQ
jgi:two-component system, sensor histidine kinase RegB